MKANNNIKWNISYDSICYLVYLCKKNKSPSFDSNTENIPHMISMLFLMYFLYVIFCQNLGFGSIFYV